MNVKDKVIVLTGGSSGMGRELTLLLLKKGARVAAIDVNPQTLQETVSLAGELKGNLSTHVANITDQKAVEALPQAILAVHKQIDGLINCAGIIQKFVLFKDLEFADIQRVMNVNFYGTLFMTKAFLPHLVKRPEAHLVNFSSMGGFLPVPAQTIYGASKAAVKLFTEALYSELMDTPVHVTAVYPGAIATNIAANSGVVMQGVDASTSKIKTTSAPEAARIILAGVEKNKFKVLVGPDAKMMDFLVRLMPKQATGIIYSQMKSLLPK